MKCDGYSFLWRTALLHEPDWVPDINCLIHQTKIFPASFRRPEPTTSVWLTFLTPHCTFWFLFSDAQLPDTLRVVYTNLAKASKFWTFWYQNLEGSGGRGGGADGISHTHRTTRQTVSVDESTKTSTPYYLPTTVDRNRGKDPSETRNTYYVNYTDCVYNTNS